VFAKFIRLVSKFGVDMLPVTSHRSAGKNLFKEVIQKELQLSGHFQNEWKSKKSGCCFLLLWTELTE